MEVFRFITILLNFLIWNHSQSQVDGSVSAFKSGKIYNYEYIISSELRTLLSANQTVTDQQKGQVELSVLENGMFKIDLKLPPNEEISTRPNDNPENRLPSMQWSHSITDVMKANLKRGLLSQLRINAKSLEVPSYSTEVDSSGECLTEYNPHKLTPTLIKLVKRKYTAGCNKRFAYRSSLYSHSVQQPSRDQKISFIDGSLVCTQYLEIANGLLNSTCKEIVTISSNSFFRGETQLIVDANLYFIGTQDVEIKSQIQDYFDPADLQLDFTLHQDTALHLPKDDTYSVLELIKENSRRTSLRQFYKAVQMLRKFTIERHIILLKVILQDQSANTKKSYTSIMISTGTVHSFELLMSNTDQLQLSSSDMLRALNNIETPNAELLPQLENLLDQYELKYVGLAVSEAVYRICKRLKFCSENAHFRRIIERFLHKTSTDCSYRNDEERHEVIIALKGLGNVGEFAYQLYTPQLLSQCLGNPKIDVSVHVAAIESVRLIKCDTNLDIIFWKYLRDPLVDIELRIHAYRQFMKCPAEAKLQMTLELMQNEPSQQFGSFVFSHLNNLVNLVGPISEPWTRYIGPYEKTIAALGKTFSLNRRSYSKHYGRLYRTNKVGVNLESLVIFGPESPVPRYVSLNLTIELFGRQSNLLECGLRTTEQSHIFKGFFGRMPGASNKELDKMESLTRKQRILVKDSSIFIRVGGQEKVFLSNLLKEIANIFIAAMKKSQQINEQSDIMITNQILLDSSFFVPTIGGFLVEINYLAMEGSRTGLENRMHLTPNSGQINWTSSATLVFGKMVKVAGFQRDVSINHWHQIAYETNIHGLFRYNNTAERKEWQIYLKDWDDDQLAFDYKQEKYALLEGKDIDEWPETQTAPSVYQTPAYINNLMGISATFKLIIPENSSEILPNQINFCVNHFRGLDAQFVLERGDTWLGEFRQFYLLFARPGESNSVESTAGHLEVSVKLGQVNQSAQYVDVQIIPPWRNEIQMHAEYNKNGNLHAKGKTSDVPWDLYGAYTEMQDQQKFTAKLFYPTGSATFAFRGNLTGNFKFQVHSPVSSWPMQFQMTQRLISSRHMHYPSFKRIHQDTQIRLRENQSLNVQLEWNTGRRNGRLEQGVIRISKLFNEGQLEMQTAITWMEGEKTSHLDNNTVHGYARQLSVDTRLAQPGEETLMLAMGADQFISSNFWMLLSDRPAVASFHAWTLAPDFPAVQLNYTTACIFKYRPDQGGMLNAFTNLIIPSENIDALAQGTLKWKSNPKAGNPWIRDSNGSLTFRIFPPQFDRYFRVNFTHAITQDVVSVVSVEFDSSTLYQIESTLYRGQPLHSLRLRWPPKRELLINTTYRLQIGPQIAIFFQNVAQNDQQLLAIIQTEFSYKRETCAVYFQHNSTTFNNNGESRLVAGIEWGSELYGLVLTNPFRINFKAAALLQIQIPVLQIDGRLEFVLGNYIGIRGINAQARCLYTRPMTQNKYGIDFRFDLSTKPTSTIQTNLDLYFSGSLLRSSGCNFKYNASDVTRMITLECSKDKVGNLVLNEKFRYLNNLNKEGSCMLSIIPSVSTERFSGWYSNFNYAFAQSLTGFSVELRGEFTPNSGTGPGTPLRFYLQFNHDESYRTGTLETVFNSQHVGYWIGYEMATTLSRYELTGLNSSDQQRRFTLRSIVGIRLLEGRGTRAYEGGLQFSISPNGDQFVALFKAGRPGMTNENTLNFEYSLKHPEPNISLELTVYNVKEMLLRSSIFCGPKWRFNEALMEVDIPRVDLSGKIHIKKQDAHARVSVAYQNETATDATMDFMENVTTESDQNLVTFSTIKGNISILNVPYTHNVPIVITTRMIHSPENKSLNSIIISFQLEEIDKRLCKSASLWISVPESKETLHQIGINSTYPWPLHINMWFGKKEGYYIYRHHIQRLPTSDATVWNTKAKLTLSDKSQIDCTLSYSTPERIVNLSLNRNPEKDFKHFEFAWDRMHNSIIQVQIQNHSGLSSLTIRTPLRDVCFQMARMELKPFNASHYERTNYTIRTTDPRAPQTARDATFTVLLYKLMDRENRTYGAQLKSDILYEGVIESNYTIQYYQDKMLANALIFLGTKLKQKFKLMLSADPTEPDKLKSQIEAEFMGNEYRLAGIHQLQRCFISSDINMSSPVLMVKPGHWNITIDQWNFIQLKNFNDTEIMHRIWRNATHGNMQQRIFVKNGLINMTQYTTLTISPIQLNTVMTSAKGRAWILSHKAGPKEFLLEAEHQSNAASKLKQEKRKDLVARILIDPSNTIHANLNWRPGLIREMLLYGTELTDTDRIKFLSDNYLTKPPKNIFLQFANERSTLAVINRTKFEQWWKYTLKDLQQIPKTLGNWWAEDRFYIKTIKVPVIQKLSEFNVSDMIRNASTINAIIVEEIGKIIFKPFNEVEAVPVELFTLIAERDTFKLITPTIKATTGIVNGTLWATKQFANFLFYKVAACTYAVNTLQSSLFNWIGYQRAWINKLTQTRFVSSLKQFYVQLQDDIPPLKQVASFVNVTRESLIAFLQQTIQYCKRLAAEAITGKELQDLVTLMANGKYENASQLFFKPHLSQFTVDLDQGLIHLSAYIPELFERIVNTLTSSQSFPIQLFSWIYPGRGMKSIMYVYDQYQRNFDALRKLTEHIPPYKVSAWMMIDKENDGFVITFNGLFIPVRKPHLGPYYLLGNTNSGRTLRIVHQFDSENGWRNNISILDDSLSIQKDGQITLVVENSTVPVYLPFSRMIDKSMWLRITRTDDRINLHLQNKDDSKNLLLMMLDLRLGQIRVELDGTWHGQCRGLLGSNTFDQLHELFGPKTETIINQTDISQEWSYSSVSQLSNQNQNCIKQVNQSLETSQLHKLCQSMWQRFFACFTEVPPNPWIQACAFAEDCRHRETNFNISEWDQRACMLASTYVQTCNLRDVLVRVPQQCVKCEADKPNSKQSLVFNKRITFIIELGSCLQKRMAEISELLELISKSKETSQIQYSAIMFTTITDLTESTQLTSKDGNIWMEVEQFRQTLDNFLVQESISESVDAHQFTEWPRAMEGLKKAIRQPSASDDTLDSILLYTCNGCTMDGFQYKTLVRVMKRKDIDFHYIPHTSFITAGDLNQRVYHLTSEGKYDEVSSSGLVKRISNIGTVNPPRDHCSLIAQESGGHIWAYQNVVTNKQRLRIVITALSNHLIRKSDTKRKCICRDNLYGAGILDCSTIINKERRTIELEKFP